LGYGCHLESDANVRLDGENALRLRKFKMTDKQTIYSYISFFISSSISSWKKSFYFLAPEFVRKLLKLTTIICLTLGIFTIWGSNPPMSYAATVFAKATSSQTNYSQTNYSSAIAINTQSLNSPRPIKGNQTTLATVYHSVECTCCKGWISHLRKEGFAIKDIPTDNIEAIKHNYKVPDKLASCHTGIINGYVIEGHVPGKDIKNLLQQKPNIIGLSVPQMPVGTPGMEMGNRKDPFNVVSFDNKDRVMIFNKYFSY
jgi:hypothetical protein